MTDIEKQKFLLNAVKFFQRNLLSGDAKGLETLNQQNITSRDSIETFKVGYGKANIRECVNPDQQYYLEEFGLVTRAGDRFRSALTMPLYDMNGDIVNIIGRSLAVNRSYQSTDSLGIGNLRALKVTDEIIATDNFFTALTLYQEGAHNTVYIHTPECFQLFKAKEITVISPRQSDELAKFAQAETIYYSNLRLRDKSAIKAFERRIPLSGIAENAKLPPKLAKVFSQKETENSPNENVEPKLKEENVGQSKELIAPKKEKTNILQRLVIDLNELGYVGEEKNKQLAFLVSISRKCQRPLSSVMVSNSFSSNTHLLQAIVDLMPPEEIYLISNKHPNSIYHEAEKNLKGKCVVYDRYQSRFAGSITESKSKFNKGIRHLGGYAYLESTLSDSFTQEECNRSLIMHLDDSINATKEVLKAQRNLRRPKRIYQSELCVEWYHEFQRNLKPMPVSIPYIDEITFPCQRLSFRHEQEKFLNILEASALLHQNERKVDRGHIYASEEDYEIAYQLFIPSFKNSFNDLNSRSKLLFETVKENNMEAFSIQEIIDLLGWSYGSAYRSIQDLLKSEYILADHQKKGRFHKTYTLAEYEISCNYQNEILDPKVLLSKHAV